MKVSIGDLLEYSFALSSDERTYKRLCHRFCDAGFCMIPRMYSIKHPCFVGDVQPGSKTKDGPLFKEALAHYSIVHMARAMGFPGVFIVRDTAYPSIDCYSSLRNLMATSEIPDDAGIVVFGNSCWVYSDSAPRDFSIAGSDRYYGVVNKRLWGSNAIYISGRHFDSYIDTVLDPSCLYNGIFNPDFYWKFPFKTYATRKNYFIQADDDLQRAFIRDTLNISKSFPPIEDTASVMSSDPSFGSTVSFQYGDIDVYYALANYSDSFCDGVRRNPGFQNNSILNGVKEIIPSGATVIDVGAGIGCMSLWLSIGCNASMVVSVEPRTSEFDLLSRTVNLNGLSGVITPINVVAGSKEGNAKLVSTSSTGMTYSVYGECVDGPGDARCSRVDTILGDLGISHIDAIMIDALGSEIRTVEGAIGTIVKSKPKIVVRLKTPGSELLDPTVDTADLFIGFICTMSDIGYVLDRKLDGDTYVFVDGGTVK